MSLELHVFIENSRVPNRDAWQQAIEKAGFPTVLEPTLDLRRDTGFMASTYKEQTTGYEFYLEPAAGILGAYPHIAEQVGSRDVCATFRWGGDLVECAAAISSAAVLANLADGIYFYPDNDVIRCAADAIDATREELASI